MKRLALALVLASFVPLHAEDADFAKLQKSYKAALEKATTPINATYIAELRKLLEKQTKAGKLDDAKVTMGEIETLTGSAEELSSVGKEFGASDREFEKFVVGTSWKHVAGAVVTFKKGGEGVRLYNNEKTPFLWRYHAPNIIEATGNLNADGSSRTFFYRIVSKKEAYYGDKIDGATAPLVYVN